MIWKSTPVEPPPRGLAVLGFYPELAPGTCFRVVRRRTAAEAEAYVCYTWRDYPPISVPEPAFWCPLPAEPR